MASVMVLIRAVVHPSKTLPATWPPQKRQCGRTAATFVARTRNSSKNYPQYVHYSMRHCRGGSRVATQHGIASVRDTGFLASNGLVWFVLSSLPHAQRLLSVFIQVCLCFRQEAFRELSFQNFFLCCFDCIELAAMVLSLNGKFAWMGQCGSIL